MTLYYWHDVILLTWLVSWRYTINMMRTLFYPAVLVGEHCNSSVTCIPRDSSFCNSADTNPTCQCDVLYRKTKTKLESCRLEFMSQAVGESCNDSQDCFLNASCASNKTCQCSEGMRTRTSQEFWADPDLMIDCIPENYSACKWNTAAVSSSLPSQVRFNVHIQRMLL